MCASAYEIIGTKKALWFCASLIAAWWPNSTVVASNQVVWPQIRR
jgi:hypothetical protein